MTLIHTIKILFFHKYTVQVEINSANKIKRLISVNLDTHIWTTNKNLIQSKFQCKQGTGSRTKGRQSINATSKPIWHTYRWKEGFTHSLLAWRSVQHISDVSIKNLDQSADYKASCWLEHLTFEETCRER